MVDEELMRCIFRRIFIVFFIVCIYQKSSKEHYRKYYGRLDSSSQLMKVLALILLLMLIPLTSASTYTLGSHQVSFELNETNNYTAKIDPPMHLVSSSSWLYKLTLMNDTSNFITISVDELSFADYSREWIPTYAELTAKNRKKMGIGGYKSSTMDFKGYPAYQDSLPAQTVMMNGESISYFTARSLTYQIDERTVVGVTSIGENEVYQEILDTIEVTDAPIKPTQYAPYISSSAGNSTSE